MSAAETFKRPKLSLIVAATPKGEIGYRQTIPWRLPGDLARFKDLTLNKVVIMGRNTLDSLPEGKPLKGRINIVVSRTLPDDWPGCDASIEFIHTHRARSVREALELAKVFGTDEIFFIGGASIYQEAMSIVDCAYVTWVHHKNKVYDTVIQDFTFCEDLWDAKHVGGVDMDNGNCHNYFNYTRKE